MTRQELEKIVEAAKVDLPKKEHWHTMENMCARVGRLENGLYDLSALSIGLDPDPVTQTTLSRKLVNVLHGDRVPVNFHWIAMVEGCIRDGNYAMAEMILEDIAKR